MTGEERRCTCPTPSLQMAAGVRGSLTYEAHALPLLHLPRAVDQDLLVLEPNGKLRAAQGAGKWAASRVQRGLC